MQFFQLAQYLQKLEDTTKRLEITSILSDLVKSVNSDEIANTMYLSLGYLDAEYKSVKFNIAEKMMIKILSSAFDKPDETIKKMYSDLGDLGSVAFKLNPKDENFKLNINQTHSKLLEIANAEGTGSQDEKINLSANLLKSSDKLSSKYLARTILGTTRLGFTELTVVDALARFVNKGEKAPKKIKKQVEAKYRIHPDIGLLAGKIKQKGLKGLSDIKITVGVPIHAQLAQRLNSPQELIEKMGKVWAEYKFDGTRVQLHLDRNKEMEIESFAQQKMFDVKKNMTFIKTYTRNLEETTHQYPDLVEAAVKYIDAGSVILDGEAIGYDDKTGEFLPFQETIQRKRKHGISRAAKEIPLKYMVFDLVYLNGKSLTNTPLTKRRELLTHIIKPNKVIQSDKFLKTNDPDEIQKYHTGALAKGFEGVMVKRINSFYEAGARNFNWVKLKKLKKEILNDTIDCTILGCYHGRGSRSKFGIGGFLAGIWDEKDKEYKTITKVGSGLTDEGWKKLKEKCDKISIPQKAKNIDSDPKYNCNVWVKPEVVVEIAADEISKSTDHTAGYALRFPRMIKYRPDKKSTDTTTLKEIKQMYEKRFK